MSRVKKLEKRIEQLECAVNRGHSYIDGFMARHIGERWVYLTLTCSNCGYELKKINKALTAEEKEAAIRLGLLPKEKQDG